MKIVITLCAAVTAIFAMGCPESHPEARGPVYVKAAPPMGREWAQLASRPVDFHGDHDVFVLGPNAGTFNEIKFLVRGAPLELDDLRVTFGNHETFRPRMRSHFEENDESRAILLPGKDRTIDHIDFHYRSINPRQGRAIVIVLGR